MWVLRDSTSEINPEKALRKRESAIERELTPSLGLPDLLILTNCNKDALQSVLIEINHLQINIS